MKLRKHVRLLSPIGGNLSLTNQAHIKTFDAYIINSANVKTNIKQIFIYDFIVIFVHYVNIKHFLMLPSLRKKIFVFINMNKSKIHKSGQLFTRFFELPSIPNETELLKNYLYLFAKIIDGN